MSNSSIYILWRPLILAAAKTSAWIQGTWVTVYVPWRDLDGSAPEWLVSDLFIHMQCAHTCAHALLRNSRHCPVCSVTKATTEFLKQLLAPVKVYTHKHTHTHTNLCHIFSSVTTPSTQHLCLPPIIVQVKSFILICYKKTCLGFSQTSYPIYESLFSLVLKYISFTAWTSFIMWKEGLLYCWHFKNYTVC